VVVEDTSMAPTLRPGDRLLVDARALRRRAPVRGEIAVVADPNGSGRWLVKRIAAVGPSVVHVVRAGVDVREPNDVRPPPPDAIESTLVPAGSVYLISEGTATGRDSRSFGPVATGALIGLAWWRYAPTGRTGPISP